jgi:hypothetical protein
VIAYAQRCGGDRAVLFVRELVTNQSGDRLHDRNAVDIYAIVRKISSGQLRGPESGE